MKGLSALNNIMNVTVLLLFLGLFSNNLYARNSCSSAITGDVTTEYISSVEGGAGYGCQGKYYHFKNLPSNFTEQTGCDISVRRQINGKTAVPEGWVAVAGSPSGCSAKGSVTYRHVSKISSAETCAGYYNRTDLSNAGLVISDADSVKLASSICKNLQISKISGPTDYMCASYSDVPSGWVVSEKSTTKNCTSATTGSGIKYSIAKIPDEGYTTTCVIPSNASDYVYQKTSGSCSIGSQKYRIGYAFDGAVGCGIPNGFMATKISTSLIINSVTCSPQYTVYEPKANNYYCKSGYTESPNGLVVSGITKNYSACNKGIRWRLEAPKDEVVFCEGNGPVPTGFGLKERGSRSECADGMGGSLTSDFFDGAVFFSLKPNLVAPWVFKKVEKTTSGVLAYTVGLPNQNDPTNICYFSQDNGPVHEDYMITADLIGPTCDAGQKMQIYPVTNNLTVCRKDNLPDNYVIKTLLSSNSSCSSSRMIITEATGNGPYHICAEQTVPSGYVITQKLMLDQCGVGSKKGTGYKIVKPNLGDAPDTITVCKEQLITNLPTKMVVRQLVSSSNCSTSGSTTAWNIGYTYTTQKTGVCTVSGQVMPEGYQQTDGSYSCNGSSGFYIAPIGGFGSVITPFVHPEPNIGPANVQSINYDCHDSSTNAGFINGANKNSISSTCL